MKKIKRMYKMQETGGLFHNNMINKIAIAINIYLIINYIICVNKIICF